MSLTKQKLLYMRYKILKYIHYYSSRFELKQIKKQLFDFNKELETMK